MIGQSAPTSDADGFARILSDYEQRIAELERAAQRTNVAPWTAVSFVNGWVNYSPGGWEEAQYRKVGDVVQLRGMVKDGTFNSIMFTLPVGFRPPLNHMFTAVTPGGVTRFDIYSSGGCQNYGSNTWYAFNASFSTI